MIGIGLHIGNRVMGGGFDSSASAFFAATGITGTTEQQAVNTLVTSLKSAGLWSKMKAVYPFVTDNKNLLSYTNAFGNGYYNTDGTSSFTPNNTTAPDGTNTATRFTAIASNNNYFYSANTSQGQSFGTGNKTLSIYVKAGTFSGNITLSITSDGNTQSTVATLTNDWQRITVSKNVIVAGGTPQYYIDLGAASMTTGQFFYIWGAQLENGTSTTTYQPIATTQQSYISNQFKYNLVNPVDSDAAFRGVFNGGWTFSNQGALPNGTNGYMDTKLVPSTNFNTSTFNHLSFYSRTSAASSGLDYNMGSSTPGAGVHGLIIRRSNDASFFVADYASGITYRGSGAPGVPIGTVANGAGYFVGTQQGSNIKFFRQNTLISQDAQPTLGYSTPSQSYYIGATNEGGTANYYTNRQTAFASMGLGLTDTEATALYNAVQTFNTSLSRQV